MALVKPIVNNITPFDATIAYTVTFTASGGDQVEKNQIKIVTNDATETVIYNHTVTSRNLSHTIPANTLTNGVYYKVAIRTYDILNNTSEWSDYLPFRCYSTPSLVFTNSAIPQTITTQTFTTTLRYTQAQNEKLDHAIIQIYSNNNAEIKNSGNLYNVNNPPLNFAYTISGLENNRQYKIKGTAVTVDGTIITTGLISFRVNYNTVPNTDTLTADVDNCNGYIDLKSNVIIKMDVTSNPDPLIYIDDEMADLLCTTSTLDNLIYTSWARWRSLVIPQDFLLRVWCYPARQPFDIIRVFNNSQNIYLKVSLKRGSTTDYISIRTNNGTTIDKALGTFCNGNTKVFIWIKVVGNSWDVRTAILETTSTIINWNDTSNNNIEYNVTSDIAWGTESYGTFTPSSDSYYALSGEMSTLMIANGIFDHLNLTMDTSIPYSTNPPSYYTPETILNIDFNGTIGESSNYTRLLLKRTDNNTSSWLNIYDVNNIVAGVPTYLHYIDKFIPTNIEQTYALVTYINNIPSDYYTIKVTPHWAKYFLSDKDNEFILNYAVIYSNHLQNIQNGVFLPIGAKYPIVIQNGEGNYRSGSLQFKVLGYQFEEDKRLDRISITKQLDDILAFLTNGKAKCLTDFNGNIYIFKVVNSPQISYDANWGNGIPTVSFDWVQQGVYNNSNDMTSLGLVDYISD